MRALHERCLRSSTRPKRWPRSSSDDVYTCRSHIPQASRTSSLLRFRSFESIAFRRFAGHCIICSRRASFYLPPSAGLLSICSSQPPLFLILFFLASRFFFFQSAWSNNFFFPSFIPLSFFFPRLISDTYILHFQELNKKGGGGGNESTYQSVV